MPVMITSINYGRAINTYPLLDQIQEQHIPNRAEAHAAIHAHLEELIQLDGEDAVIISREPISPLLEISNPLDRDKYYWLTITDEAEQAIRDAIAATHPRIAGPQVTAADIAELLSCGADDPVMYVERDEYGDRIAVGSQFRINDRLVITHQHELRDDLGDEATPDDVAEHLPLLQATVDEILNA
ncbi:MULTISPECIES: hypothetical protein [unclassified Streptomyces]|uniref:hypothetical protein n=1 Tax=unclassified Streptomyces TaxID=2593676 RepID=UPI00227128E3|nr:MULTISPECIES: hypothetical protein [unclassified Streptomyces]MCY0923446.1 hypothetical protein [Streptomyces sp. H27-G5]MCY0961878.1 hypothetical protein [Streptomyces sp. H27-H5]